MYCLLRDIWHYIFYAKLINILFFNHFFQSFWSFLKKEKPPSHLVDFSVTKPAAFLMLER
tara:strand:- start:48466 stop:48645 length:180 start_codon:yes stop_codon:yes gene_type:complete